VFRYSTTPAEVIRLGAAGWAAQGNANSGDCRDISVDPNNPKVYFLTAYGMSLAVVNDLP
jgi:hypothetical protein